MSNLRMYAYEDESFIKGIAKMHTESDIMIYGRKEDRGNLTVFMPSRYPDKISSMTDAMTLSHVNIINGKVLNSYLGENLLCADLMGKREGYITVDQTTDRERLKSILKSSNLSEYTIFEGSSMDLINQVHWPEHSSTDQKTSVIIDHFFKVKSVGTVILGFVLSGKLTKHQELYLNPGKKRIQVKSIQMNDVDFNEADVGSRVGLSLKNAEVEDIQRGSFLSEVPVDTISSISGEVIFHPTVPADLRKDGEVFVAGDFIYSRGVMEEGVIKMDKAILPRKEYILVRPNSKPRIVGKIIVK